MKTLWGIFAAASAGALYFTPPPAPGEQALHYIMHANTTWQSMSFTVVAAFAAAALLMGYLMRQDT